MQQTPDDTGVAFPLPPILNAKTADAVGREIFEHRYSALTVDASALETLDAYGVEILLSLAKQWRIDKSAFHLVALSSAKEDYLKEIGCEPEMLEGAL